MLQPSSFVLTIWIMVRPVNHSTFVVPFILTIERNAIALCEVLEARGQINIVCYEQRLS
jgi:hypothetical protein